MKMNLFHKTFHSIKHNYKLIKSMMCYSLMNKHCNCLLNCFGVREINDSKTPLYNTWAIINDVI